MHASKATKVDYSAAGLSHILDPAYSGAAVSSSPRSVYMDLGDGQLHDADYHHFVLPSLHSSHLHPSSSSNAHHKFKSNPNMESRFAWELEAAALSGDDEGEQEEEYAPRRRSFSSDYSSSPHSSPSWSPSPMLFDEGDLYVPFSVEENDRHNRLLSPRDALTCSPPPRGESPSLALRRQWLALSLRVRFKAYRVKKRISNR